LKSPEDSINPQALSFKYMLVPFFPYKVDTNAQGNSSHPSFKIAFPKPQTTQSTIQSRHAPTNLQPGLNLAPQAGCPFTCKKKKEGHATPPHTGRTHKGDH
jgi:hypothetical protein